ncbi:uncharacterized protein LOC123666866 [Melitaea cinxia]|uniref:uncharacterized protein LOC123666409 n=1 Tax=Melitaea cinxia TaxID=113334 RepID=UPI001E271A58|nr:uncharacterized protein LOC123666409 [Melitaea cinxia]XP_045456848.1 uncharacterized protein LOC123666866 [Melitaea cinxia]
MFRCARCDAEFRDGVQCSLCQGHYDFPCAGITEGGYRKLGDRKSTWKCSSCKSAGVASSSTTTSSTVAAKSPTPTNMESIALELKRLSIQMSSLQTLATNIQAIQADIAELKTIKASVEYVQCSVEALSNRCTEISQEVQSLLKTREELQQLQQRFSKLEVSINEYEQRSRINNIEIKGVPSTPSENLFEVVGRIGDVIGCSIPKEHINYIARIPTRNDKGNKSIIVSVHSRYLKEDFVAAAKKRTIVAANLGLHGESRIFINDHLTLQNKLLLNKAKNLAKERGFAFVWVRGCKIFARKNPTAHVIRVISESDLKKII